MKKPIKFIIPKSTYIPVHPDNKKKMKKSTIECQTDLNEKNENENENENKNKNENENENENETKHQPMKKTEKIIVRPSVTVINEQPICIPPSQYGYSWIPSEVYNYGCTFPRQYCPLTNYAGPTVYSSSRLCNQPCYQPYYQPCYQSCYQPCSNPYFNPYI